MKLFLAAVAAVFVNGAMAKSCVHDTALQIAENIASLANPFCTQYLSSCHLAVTGLPAPLSNYIPGPVHLSSVCSCLLTSTASPATTTCSPTAPSATATTTINTKNCPTSFLTCTASTVTSTVAATCTASVSRITITAPASVKTDTITASGTAKTITQTIIDTVTASAPIKTAATLTATDFITLTIGTTAPIVTDTLTATITVTVSPTALVSTAIDTVTVTVSPTALVSTAIDTVTITASGTAIVSTATATITVTITPPAPSTPATVTITLTATATAPGTTVTALPPAQSIDQSGCPAINGDSSGIFVIQCGHTADPSSFDYLALPGYNIEDCASQCFDDPENIDCLGVVFSAPNPTFSSIDGKLQPGTCTFYEYISATIPAAGHAVAAFDGLGLSKM